MLLGAIFKNSDLELIQVATTQSNKYNTERTNNKQKPQRPRLCFKEMAAMMSMKAALQSPTNQTFRRRDRNATLRPAAKMSTRIHRLIEEQGVVLMPGCYDALSAAIVQKSGFSAGFISGYALSASLLGKPDFGLLTYASSHSSSPSSLSRSLSSVAFSFP